MLTKSRKTGKTTVGPHGEVLSYRVEDTGIIVESIRRGRRIEYAFYGKNLVGRLDGIPCYASEVATVLSYVAANHPDMTRDLLFRLRLLEAPACRNHRLLCRVAYLCDLVTQEPKEIPPEDEEDASHDHNFEE